MAGSAAALLTLNLWSPVFVKLTGMFFFFLCDGNDLVRVVQHYLYLFPKLISCNNYYVPTLRWTTQESISWILGVHAPITYTYVYIELSRCSTSVFRKSVFRFRKARTRMRLGCLMLVFLRNASIFFFWRSDRSVHSRATYYSILTTVYYSLAFIRPVLECHDWFLDRWTGEGEIVARYAR